MNATIINTFVSFFLLKIHLFWWSLWSNNHCYLVLLPPWFEKEKLIQECKLSRICNCVLHQSAGPRPMLGMSHTLQSTLNPVLYTTRTDHWSVISAIVTHTFSEHNFRCRATLLCKMALDVIFSHLRVKSNARPQSASTPFSSPLYLICTVIFII